MNEEIVFANEEEPDHQRGEDAKTPWVILVVDDDQMVQEITALALEDFVFEGRRLELIKSYSAKEAESVLASRSDIAVILLDVVMETATAGLDLVPRIRGLLGNQQVRIVLRTGQPGRFSEAEIVRNIAINDYLHKTELTTKKLEMALIFALRDYQDIDSHHQPPR